MIFMLFMIEGKDTKLTLKISKSSVEKKHLFTFYKIIILTL